MRTDKFPMDIKMTDPDIYDPSVMETFPREIREIEMSAGNRMFLAGLLKRFKPRTILECGVSAGGSSALFLHLIDKLGLDCELVSVDLNEKWYKNGELETGWAAQKFFPNKKNWKLMTGKFLPEIIEKLDMEFDFCFLDTMHCLPGEMLDYLVALPFMREDGIFAFHDSMLHIYSNNNSFATRVLTDVCVGDKIYPPQDTVGDANISAFQITPDTYKYVSNVFAALCMRWAYPLDNRQFFIYYNFFLRYYGGEAADWFARAKDWNNANLEKPAPAPKAPVKRTDAQIVKMLARTMLKNILPYGIIRFAQFHRQ